MPGDANGIQGFAEGCDGALLISTHAGIPDTSEMMYLGGDAWVRKDKIVGEQPENGIRGDPRPSSPELGKRVFDMKVDYGAEEIQRLIRSATNH